MAQVEILSLNIDTQQLIARLGQTRQEIERLQTSQRALTQAGQTSSEQFIRQGAQLQNLQTQSRNQTNVLNQLTAANTQASSATQAVNTALNRNITSIQEATENSRQLTVVRNQLNLATAEGQAALVRINQRLDENTEFIRANVSAQEQQRMNIGAYSQSIQDALQNLNPFNGGLAAFQQRATAAGGTSQLLRQNFSALGTGIAGVTRQALAFIATPIGAAIAAITAAFVAGKAIFDFNQGLQESNKELKALGVNAGDLSKVRSELSATAETFDKEFKDIASKANSLAKAYGISMSEANDIIAQGLASGGAQNEEFLDSVGEYDQLFQKAGFSAQEFVNIINTGYDLGIYSDKLPDAIKEANLALSEQGKATRDALVNSFGASFSDEILKKVRTGEMTTKEALDAIAKKSSEVSLTQQQQAQLTADVFKGAGEDAGGAAKILEAISKASNKELDATAKTQLELVEATERLNKAQAGLFEVKDFGSIWTGIKTVAIDALSATLEYLADMKKDLQPLIDFVGVVFVNAWYQLKTVVGVAFNLIRGGIQVLTNYFSTFFNFFKALVQGDFKGAIKALTDGFQNLLSIVGNTFGRIKNSIIDGLKGIVDNIKPILSALGVDVDKLSKKLEGLKSKNVDVKASTKTTDTTVKKEIVADVDPNAAANAKAAADATKKARDEQAKAVDALIKKQKEEIDLFISGQGIKKKSIQDQLKLEEQIMQKRLALNELEYSKGKISKEQYETQKLTITNNYLGKQADATVAIAAQELEQYRQSIQKKKDDDTFFTQQKLEGKVAENNALAEKEIAFQATRLEEGVINQQEYNDAVNAINEANRLRNEEAEVARKEAKAEQDAIDLENQQILDEEKFTNQFDIDTAREQIRYQAELKAAEKTGADTTKIKQKHANNDKKIEELKEQAVRQMYADTFGQVAGLLGQKSQASKAAAIAEATMNTYNGITQVWAADSVLPEPFATAAKVVSTGVVLASGLGAVKKITSVPTSSFAEGGVIPTLSSGVINNGSNIIPLANGDDTLAYVGQGEVILNKDQQRRAGGSAFFRSIGVPGFFANGGYVGGMSQSTITNNTAIDYDLLASKIGDSVGRANQQLPPPIVQVDTITEAQSIQSYIKAGASF